ncbi:DUF5696 domain-containing protein [Lederbergia ruris]|uniref:DUF5696 domain-containing protein n=1 Tax=Lederbergia ruris TaxID=217495 RepID=UPI0039A39CC3
MFKKKAMLLILLALLLIFSSGTVMAQTDSSEGEQTGQENVADDNQDTEESAADDTASEETEVPQGTDKVVGSLPDESKFEAVAENENLILQADPKSGHFTVTNKQSGKVLRSFPNPQGWGEGQTSEVWQVHLQSPFMFTYVEFNVRKDVVKESNFNSQGGTVDYKKIENGFQITYDLPKMGFVIPVEVRLADDYVETRILADDIVDGKEAPKDKEEAKKDPKSRLVSLRLFPFLGAETSEKENGYVFLPDGPGALIEFQKDRASTNNLYTERVYGDDLAFSSNSTLSNRQPVRMPTFGIKAGNDAFLGIIEDGDVYANIVSAPSQSLSQYNWVTAEHLFRFKFFQPTNRKTFAGFHTYSEEMQRGDRSVRYYMLEGKDPGYVDMATKYREYLMKDQGLSRQEASENIRLQLDLLGGGTKNGFIRDSFLSLTTTEEATQMVKELNSLGVEDMEIHYYGWQRKGYENYGGHFPVAKKLGGNEGMKKFVDFAHNKGFAVYLDASSYTFNNTNKDGFRPNRDGLRDLSSTIIKFYEYGGDNVLVSPKFMEKTILKDFKKAKELQIDGYLYGSGIGAMLSTDYNDQHFADRQEAKEIQENIMAKTKEELGEVRVTYGNFYSLKNINHLRQMENDYSYDLFVDRKIPFAQIALHGLMSYSFDYGNIGGDTKESFLQGIEYGALPSFILTYEKTQKLMDSNSLRRFYSTYYKGWEEEIAAQYQSFNEALADVQDQFIVDHQQIAKGVFKTTYENGKSIVVNYNKQPYHHGDLAVEAEDYTILEGGR